MAGGKGGTKLKDIADLVGCSLATVSNAINGRGRMSEDMRKEILEKCAELNFVPNSAGRSLRLQRADAVGVIYAPSFAELFGNVFYARIMEGLTETFGDAGLDLILGNRKDIDGLPSIVRQGKVDALIVLAGVFEAEAYESLRDCPVPVCMVDGHVGALAADAVTSDGFGGGRLVAEYLVGEGHKRVRMVAYGSPLYNIEQRIAGFLSGLRASGVEAREDEVVIRVADNDEAMQRVLEESKSGEGPTAIFTVNDTLAEHLATELPKSGIEVPKDISLIGFDDDPLARRCKPALTTVGMDKRIFGAISAGLVLERLAKPDKPLVHHVQPTRLVIRDSVAKIG